MKRTKSPKSTPYLLQVMSALNARMAIASRLGYEYGGDRDLYEALGYKTDLEYDDFYAQFTRHDIAAAVINRPIRAAWKGNLEVTESKRAEETAFEKAWKDLDKSMKFKSKLKRLDKLTGLGEYGVLLLGLSDVQKKEDFNLPVKRTADLKLLYINVFGQKSIQIQSYITNTKDPRYGLPLTYQITLTNASESSTETIIVHYSRIIHVVDEPTVNDILGTPRLEQVWNRLKDLEKIVGGSGEMFWRGARPGYQAKMDENYTMTDVELEALQDQLDEYENNLRRILKTEGFDLKELVSQISDPSKHVDVNIQMISAATGIPKRILTGSERGELSSEQDSEEWKTYVQERRENFMEPQIVRPLVDILIEYKVLPKPSSGDYVIIWEDLFAVSEKAKVDIGVARSNALNSYANNAVAQEVIPVDAFLEMFLGFSQDQIDLIKSMIVANPTPIEEPITEEEEEVIDEEEPLTQGGQGSGNFGHERRTKIKT